MTAVYGIFGYPIGHSRSPALHTAGFVTLGIDAVYVPFAVPPQLLADAVTGARALNLQGFNITLPHKTAVIPLLDRVEPDALAIGAVNTVVREGDALVGLNTDAPGLARSLIESGVSLSGATVTVLGAGGAARASVVGIARAGAARIYVTARRLETARELVEQLQGAVGGTSLRAISLLSDALTGCLAATDLLVQATSATLDDAPAAQELVSVLPLSSLPKHASVVDLVYRPLQTRVLTAAKHEGLRTLDGLGMLLHQGTIAFERWTGRAAPIDVMRAALQAQPGSKSLSAEPLELRPTMSTVQIGPQPVATGKQPVNGDPAD